MRFLSSIVLTIITINIAFGQGLLPSAEYAITPEDYGMDYKEVEISGEVKLHGWFFKPTEATKKIVIISDDGKGNMADNIEIVSNFLSLGYHVLTYDYRGFGKSGEFKINSKFFIRSEFQKDLESVINYVKKYHAKLTVVDLYGVGIGAGMSISVGCNNINIKHIVADAPYYSLEATKRKIKEVMGTELMMPLGYNKIQFEPKYALVEKGKHISGILVFIGETDAVFGPDQCKELSKGSITKVTCNVVAGVENGENFSSNKDEYFNTIKKFLGK